MKKKGGSDGCPECHLVDLHRPISLSPGQRTKLPAEFPPRHGYNIWEIIRPNLGKDFSRFRVPVTFNEPMSMLQRLAESYMSYAELLISASTKKDPLERFELVCAYVLSGMTSNKNRLTKPFNPLLLETFELEREGVRFVAEQVSHHPPVSAFHVEGPGFVLSGSVSPKLSFWINRLICAPTSSVQLTFTNLNESYSWDVPNCAIYNIMFGKLYMNATGTLTIHASSGNYEAKLSFDGGNGWDFKNLDVHVDGFISRGRERLRAIYGNWSQFIASCDSNKFKECLPAYQKLFLNNVNEQEKAPLVAGSKILWVAHRMPERHEMMCNFTYVGLSLNELSPTLAPLLPPTDSRLRQDIVLLEQGRNEEAEHEKDVLEKAQRQRRADGIAEKPRWFSLDSAGRWKFGGTYWSRDFAACDRILGDRPRIAKGQEQGKNSNIDSGCSRSSSSSSHSS